MKLFKFSILSFVFLSLVVGAPVFAVETPIMITNKIDNQNLVSDVGLYNTKIVSQEGNKINISFDVVGGTVGQSGLKYSVYLVQEKAKTQLIIDEYVYTEIINPIQGNTIKKEIVYNAPENLNGEYTIFIKMINYSGASVAVGTIGKIKLTKIVEKEDIVELLKDTCYLSILENKDNSKYGLIQGVNISPLDKLVMNCTVSNLSKKEITVTPVYETHQNNIYGEVVYTEDVDLNPVVFKSLEKKILTFTIPKNTRPQFYTVRVSLKGEEISSNSIIANYRILGESAYIKNILLDKDSYKKGDTAKFKLDWFYLFGESNLKNVSEEASVNTGNDDIYNPNIYLTLSIKDEMERKCIDPINQTIDHKNNTISIDLPITRDCKNPQVSISIKDSKGNILDNKEISFGESLNPSKMQILFAKYGMIIFIILVVAGIVVFYFIKLKKKGHIESDLNKSNEAHIQ